MNLSVTSSNSSLVSFAMSSAPLIVIDDPSSVLIVVIVSFSFSVYLLIMFFNSTTFRSSSLILSFCLWLSVAKSSSNSLSVSFIVLFSFYILICSSFFFMLSSGLNFSKSICKSCPNICRYSFVTAILLCPSMVLSLIISP